MISARSLSRAEASFTWSTCRALVATGRTKEPPIPAEAMEADNPDSVPSENAAVWDMDWSFSRVERAILSGKVWVWMSKIMGSDSFLDKNGRSPQYM